MNEILLAPVVPPPSATCIGVVELPDVADVMGKSIVVEKVPLLDMLIVEPSFIFDECIVSDPILMFETHESGLNPLPTSVIR
jgi:hypothetical protein